MLQNPVRLARVQNESFAVPMLALGCDGAWYDVGCLQQRWHPERAYRGESFHAHLVTQPRVRLHALYDRLRAGDRPTEARLVPGHFLKLPPCDAGSVYVQLGPYDLPADAPRFEVRSARTLVGHDQPVPFPAGVDAARCEVGVAAVLGDDLWQASPRDIARGILGYTLVIDWLTDGVSGVQSSWRPAAPTQLGPDIVTADELPDLARRALRIEVEGRPCATAAIGDWPFEPAEAIGYLAQHVPLQAGDVVGLGAVVGGRLPAEGTPLAFRDRVTVSLDRALRLRGWAVPGLPVAPWRRQG